MKEESGNVKQMHAESEHELMNGDGEIWQLIDVDDDHCEWRLYWEEYIHLLHHHPIHQLHPDQRQIVGQRQFQL